MSKAIFVLIFLLLACQSKGQESVQTKIWNHFHELIILPLDKQLEGFQALKKECEKINLTTDSTYTNLLFLYAGAHFANGNLQEAISSLNETIKISIQYPRKTSLSYLSKYYFYLGYYESQQGNFQSAIENYNRAYTVGIQQFNKWGIPSLACQALSHLYYEAQDYEQGLIYANLGITTAQKFKDSVNLTKNLYEKCVNLNALDRTAEVEPQLDTLLSLAHQYASESEKGIYYKLMGDFFFKRKNYSAAKVCFITAAKLYKKAQYIQEIGLIYIDLSYVATQMNDIELAEQYEKIALKYTTNRYGLSRLYYNKALFMKQLGQHRNSLNYIHRSLLFFQQKPELRNIFENPSSKQLKHLTEKDYAFTPLLDKAEILSLDKNNKTNLNYALKTYLLLDTLVDYIRWQHQGIATKLFWREKLNSLYEQAIETCYQLNNLEKAFYFLEKSRAVLLLDQLNSNAAQSFLPKAEAEREATLRMQVSHYQNNSYQHEQLSDFLQAQAKLDEYVKDLEKRYPRYYEYKYNNRVPTLVNIQQYLTKSKQSLLSYYEGKNGVYILVVTPQNSYLKKINSATYYSGKEQLKSFFGNNNQFNQQYDQYLQVSNRFYQLFLAPIKTYLTQRVIVSTSGAIIPFAALSISAQKPDYLVQQYAFSYTYSARALLNNPVQFPTENEDTYFLGIAPVHFPYKSSLATLFTSKNALKDNRKLFHSSRLLTNENANKSNFEDQWPRAKVVQLISHAYADQESIQPVIYLADSGLSLNDINQQRVQTQLLVLSACRTGIGKDYKGEGVFSLSRGFMGTGVPSIYSTLWDVEDQDAYALSYQILKSATKQIPLDLALQMAQLDWLSKADRSKQLPNAWAGIILLGSSNPLPSEPFSYSWIFYTLAICLLLVFGFCSWFKRKGLTYAKK